MRWQANTRRRTNAGLMLAQRRRRWASIRPASVQHLVVTWLAMSWIIPIKPYTRRAPEGIAPYTRIQHPVPSGLFIDQLGILTIVTKGLSVNAFSLLAQCWFSILQRWSNIHPSLGQHLVSARFKKGLIPAAIRRWVFVVWILAHRLQRWPSIASLFSMLFLK